jgi:hypothetical protein
LAGTFLDATHRFARVSLLLPLDSHEPWPDSGQGTEPGKAETYAIVLVMPESHPFWAAIAQKWVFGIDQPFIMFLNLTLCSM